MGIRNNTINLSYADLFDYVDYQGFPDCEDFVKWTMKYK